MSLNTALLTGRLTKAPESRDGTKSTITTINIAVKDNIKNAEGDYDSQFFRISFFGTVADIIANHAMKGQLVTVTGRLRTNERSIGGEKVWTTEIIGTGIDLLSKPQHAATPDHDEDSELVTVGEGN
jgi:single-strand DNA-binding protein